jgi:hypothetical protein
VSQPLRDAWRIETSSRSRAALTLPANIAHLRNPITILGASSALLQQLQRPLTPILLASIAHLRDPITILGASSALLPQRPQPPLTNILLASIAQH